MKNRNVELVVESEEYIEPFDETKIYFVLNSCGKNIDEGTRLIYEEYEREGKQIGSIAVLEPSYDQWGRMGKIAGQTYVGEKMFDRFTTAPQGVQTGALISEMLKKRN